MAGHLLYSKSFTNGSPMLKYLHVNNSIESGQTAGGWLNQNDPELTINLYDVQFFSVKDCLFKVKKKKNHVLVKGFFFLKLWMTIPIDFKKAYMELWKV